MRKLLLLVPLLLVAGCSGDPKLACTVEIDTRRWYDGKMVELEVSSEAKPGQPGYGKLYLNGTNSIPRDVELPYVMGGKRVAELADGRVLYLSSCWERAPEPWTGEPMPLD